jgi:hypothetical protein
MSIGEKERKTQNRVILLFQKKLKYDYLGNWEDRPDNSNIEEHLLRNFLKRQGYRSELIKRALYELKKIAGDQNKSLYDINKEVYGLLRYGVQAKIDENKPIDLQYMICFPAGCQAQIDLTPELFDAMRKGKEMVFAAVNFQQKTMGFPVPLSGFNKAYDGPAADPVKYEESRKQLMEMFRKKAEIAAAKAAQGQAPGQTGAMPGAMPAPAGQAPAGQNGTMAPKKQVAPPPQ